MPPDSQSQFPAASLVALAVDTVLVNAAHSAREIGCAGAELAADGSLGRPARTAAPARPQARLLPSPAVAAAAARVLQASRQLGSLGDSGRSHGGNAAGVQHCCGARRQQRKGGSRARGSSPMAATRARGWDPADARANNRLRAKLSQIRARLDHEQSPEEFMSTGKRTRTRNRSLRWTAWCRDAFIALDDHQGTTDDICAVLLANPKIAPLLDHRVRADKRSVPQWRNQVFCIARKVPGVVKTGEKRGGRAIYRYDPEAAALLAAGAKRTRRTKARGGKGESSMPHLGAAQ